MLPSTTRRFSRIGLTLALACLATACERSAPGGTSPMATASEPSGLVTGTGTVTGTGAAMTMSASAPASASASR